MAPFSKRPLNSDQNVIFHTLEINIIFEPQIISFLSYWKLILFTICLFYILTVIGWSINHATPKGVGEEGSSEKRHPAIIYTPVHAVGPPVDIFMWADLLGSLWWYTI